MLTSRHCPTARIRALPLLGRAGLLTHLAKTCVSNVLSQVPFGTSPAVSPKEFRTEREFDEVL